MSSAADIRVSFPRGEYQFVGLQAYLHAASQAVEHLLCLAPSFRGDAGQFFNEGLKIQKTTLDILGSPRPRGNGLQTCITRWRDLALTYSCGIGKKGKELSQN